MSSPRSAVAWALLLPNSCGLVLSLFASPAEKGKRRPASWGPGGGGGGGRGSVAPVELLAAEVPNAQLSEAAARPAAAAAPLSVGLRDEGGHERGRIILAIRSHTGLLPPPQPLPRAPPPPPGPGITAVL